MKFTLFCSVPAALTKPLYQRKKASAEEAFQSFGFMIAWAMSCQNYMPIGPTP